MNTGVYTPTSNPSLDTFFPPAKIGGNYIYVWSLADRPNTNYFGLSHVIDVGSIMRGTINSIPGLTVTQAYAIDKKIDDGFPQSGNVLALYAAAADSDGWWAGLSSAQGWNFQGVNPYTGATPGSATTCFDNGNVAGAPQQYSIEISNGSNVNCALSFKMQAGD